MLDLFDVLFIAAGSMVVLTFYLSYRVIAILRRRHEAVWRSLGSPTFFMNNAIENGLALSNFLRSDKLEGLRDAELSKLALAIRSLASIYCLILAGLILMVFFRNSA